MLYAELFEFKEKYLDMTYLYTSTSVYSVIVKYYYNCIISYGES